MRVINQREIIESSWPSKINVNKDELRPLSADLFTFRFRHKHFSVPIRFDTLVFMWRRLLTLCILSPASYPWTTTWVVRFHRDCTVDQPCPVSLHLSTPELWWRVVPATPDQRSLTQEPHHSVTWHQRTSWFVAFSTTTRTRQSYLYLWTPR